MAPINRSDAVVVGRPRGFYERSVAIGGVITWLGIVIIGGPSEGLNGAGLLAIAVWLGASALMRVRIQDSTLLVTVLGPWRSSVNLSRIQSIRGSNTARGRARGNIYVTDRGGGRVRIPVKRFDGIETWGRALLDGAATCHASVDPTARELLESAGTPVSRVQGPAALALAGWALVAGPCVLFLIHGAVAGSQRHFTGAIGVLLGLSITLGAVFLAQAVVWRIVRERRRSSNS